LDRPARSSPVWQRAKAAAEQHPDSRYEAFRDALRATIPYVWRRRTVLFFRGRLGLVKLQKWLQRQTSSHWPFRASGWLIPRDFYEGLTLLPYPSTQEIKAILDRPVSSGPFGKADVVCFSIIDWSFRFQRPQQIMRQFAEEGHRVFYLNVTEFLDADLPPRFTVEALGRETLRNSSELYEIKIALHQPLDLYRTLPSETQKEEMILALDGLRKELNLTDAIGYVMFPSWSAVARYAQQNWDWRIIYDCMDEWENFPGVQLRALSAEPELADSCDLLIVTAQRLLNKWKTRIRPSVLARNAVDYDFYAERCRPNGLLPGISHPVVGYYGAIADWFDIDLLAEAARLRPGFTFVVLGGIFHVDVTALRALPNIQVLGQQPYEAMPEYLYHFDACIIPFKLNAITRATDPVKFYEYLSGGKPVVSVRLPELEAYRDFVYFADDAPEFVAQLDRALAEHTPERAELARALARKHTWQQRYRSITGALNDGQPKASIIVIAYNNLELTRLCLESVLRNTGYPAYEVIVVDNGSRDGTRQYLESLASHHSHVSIILNDDNLGFPKANNQGISRAIGEYIVLLNNDTVVPRGWLSRLLRHLEDPEVGLVGPRTNSVGNEARLSVSYASWVEMEDFARCRGWDYHRKNSDIGMLAMFCVAMRRSVYDRVGPLDEQFGVGMFEDDDYSMRVRAAGLRVVCAADAFVHHFGQAAFGKLIESGRYDAIYDENRKRYEAKWGPYSSRAQATKGPQAD
jgi:GT2 family glycosyltransferase